MSTYYIATTGNDTTGNGSLATPWLTLAKFLASSTTGDTCMVGAGTFTFAAATITNRTIQGTRGTGVTNTTGWTVFTGSGSGVRWAFGTGTTVVKDIWFDSCVNTSTSNSGGLITCGNTVTPVFTITGCRFSNCSGGGGDSGSAVIGSTGWIGLLGNITIGSCIFDNCNTTYNNVSAYFSMRGAVAGSTFNFFNNVFIVRTTPTVSLSHIITGYNEAANTVWTLKNNIFVCRLTNRTFSFGATCTMSNNCLVGAIIPAAVVQSNNITSEPLFIDEDNQDFRLRPTSPCLGTGTIV